MNKEMEVNMAMNGAGGSCSFCNGKGIVGLYAVGLAPGATCPRCNGAGTGTAPEKPQDSQQNGTGWKIPGEYATALSDQYSPSQGIPALYLPVSCLSCEGTGFVGESRCKACEGTGTIWSEA